MKIPKLFTALIGFIICTGSASAQMIFKAYPDNAFVEPNSTDYKQIDVLANDHYYFENPTDCMRDGLVLEIVTDGTLGRARISSDNQVEYRPRPNMFGADQVEYKIYCPTSRQTSTAIIYINVNDQPNVISDKDCYVDPVGIGFEMELLTSSRNAARYVDPTSYIIAGDVDGDGDIEILVEAHPGIAGDWNPDYVNPRTYRILIFGYNKTTNTLALKYSINLPYPASELFPEGTTHALTRVHPFGQLAIAKITGGGVNAKNTPSIFYANPSNCSLFRYDFNPVTRDFEETWRSSYWSDNFAYVGMSPNISDLMGDGNQQVVLGHKIFNADTGILLATAMDGTTPIVPPNHARSTYGLGFYGHTLGSRTVPGVGVVSAYPSGMVVTDIDDDGVQEVIGGDCVYKVNITNYTSSVGNDYKFHLRAKNTNHPGISDGATAVADINNDGKLDIIVAGPMNGKYVGNADACLYVYNPRTGDIMHTNHINNIPRGQTPAFNYGPSRPFVGDIDGDGYPEICLSSYNVLRAYDLDNTNTLKMKWNLPTTDISSSTTLSMFDFAQDKQARMVYRDEDNLRVIRSTNTSPITEVTVPNIGSPTVNEYPIIVDINGDGHAEIITIGANPKNIPNPANPTATTWNWDGTVQIYAAKGEKKWAPARPVWHQNSYNPVFVNDDLTIPARPISLATAFISPDGRLDRPFNNFLQQATNLNKEGLMIMLGPDLMFDSRVPKRISIDEIANTLTITAGVINIGDAAFTGPIKLQLYSYVEATSTYTAVGAPYSYPNTSLGFQSHNNTVTITYTIPNTLGVYDNLVMAVNVTTPPDVKPEFSGSAECHDGINNFTSGFSLVSGRRVVCEGDTETINVTPNGTYTVKWYADAKGGSPINIGDSYAVTKNSDQVQYYFVETYRTPSSITPISTIRDTVFIYKSPDSLVWNGKAGNKDWHDYLNWTNPDASFPEVANIPRKCTHVLIPKGIANYPDLAPKTNMEATDYREYLESECNHVSFNHGGEITRPDLLVYENAYVDVTFSSHRWQMFAPPLKDFYTGDIYRNNIIPFHDDIKAYTKFWGRRNPINSYYTAGWTGTFHTPDASFEAGQGLGLWISDKSISGQPVPPRDPFDFSFPKQETEYRIYKEDTDIPVSDPFSTPRVNNYRFIFDGASSPGVNFNLKIDGQSTTAGQMVLVGNPFMAHLDFDKFFSENSNLIQNYYAVLDENANMQYYNKGTSTLSKNIAPMQAFLVEIKTPLTSLKANGMMTSTVPGDKLKSEIEDELEDNFQLTVSAHQDGYAHKAFLKFEKNASDNYIAGEDIAALFPAKVTSDSRALSIYSQSEDGFKSAVNKFNISNLENKTIALGIWSPKKDVAQEVTINVSNVSKVPSIYDLFIEDRLTGEKFNLRLNSMKSFKNVVTDKDAFVDGRFFLTFKDNGGTSIEEEVATDNISAWVHNSKLHLHAEDIINTIDVYNLGGKLLFTTRCNSNSVEFKLPYEQLYIVKVKSNNGILVKKLLNQ